MLSEGKIPTYLLLIFFSGSLLLLITNVTCESEESGEGTAPVDGQNEAERAAVCQRTASDADGCMRTLLIFGDREFVPPTNARQMSGFCRREREAIACVKAYGADCLPPFPRTLFNIGASGAIRQQRRVCNSRKQSKQFLSHMKCGEVYGMETSHSCMEAAIIKMEMVAKTAKAEDQIPRACCVFHPLRDCIVTHIVDHCRGITNETATAAYFESVLQGAMGDLLDLACGKYSDTAACLQHMPDLMGEFAAVERRHLEKSSPQIRPKSKSILMPFVHMLYKSV